MIQSISSTLEPNDDCMFGSATLTMLESSTAVSAASMTGSATSHLFPAIRRAGFAVDTLPFVCPFVEGRGAPNVALRTAMFLRILGGRQRLVVRRVDGDLDRQALFEQVLGVG